MKKLFHLLAAILILGAVLLSARAGEVIDRIVATVNGHVISQSDWDEALCYQAFLDGRALGPSTLEDRKASLDRLIDQELIREQMHSFELPHASAAEVDRRIQVIRKLHAEATSDSEWQAALAGYGLSASELRKQVAMELDELRAVDAHLRPSVQVDSRSVEIYYREKLLPELRKTGAKEVSLAEVAPKIKELLAQQEMNDLLVTWLRTLRAESEIHTPFQASAAPRGGSR